MDGSLPPAYPLSTSSVCTSVGRVLESKADETVLALGTGRVHARRATSCLVEPEVGDLVMAAETADAVFILAVLERPTAAAAILSIPGASSTTLAQDAIALRCETLTVDAGTTTLRSRIAQVAGRTLGAVAERLDVVARTLRRSADHEFSHAKASTRTVEGPETIKAGELMLEAKSALAQRAGIVLVDAREDVRVNGERITMG